MTQTTTKEIEKGALLGEFEGKFQTDTLKEVTPLGHKFEYYAVGHFAGIFDANASHTNNVFVKDDGTVEWESKGFLSTTDGEQILEVSRGTGRLTGPGTSRAEGEGVFMTRYPKLSWLNNKKFRLEITASFLTGEEKAKIFAL